MARIALLLLLAAGALADPPDGTIAPAARWTGPNGAASGSRRSAALPVMGDVEEAWSLRPRGCERIETPPCLWDGRGFFLASGDNGRFLFCFDVRTGKRIARKKVLANSLLQKFRGTPAIHVWDRWILVEQPGRPAIGYLFGGRSFTPAWRPPFVEGTLNLTAFENEIYLPSNAYPVECRRPGFSGAEWTASGLHTERKIKKVRGGRIYIEEKYVAGSRPAVRGPYVFVLLGISKVASAGSHRIQGYGVSIHVYRRDTGRLVGSKYITENLGSARTPDRPGWLLVTESKIYAECPWPLRTGKGATISRSQLILAWREARGKVLLEQPRVTEFVLPPAHHESGTIALLRKPELTWALLQGDRWLALARVGQQPDLFTSRVPPTVVGDIVYFGNFAVDLATREILWKLPVEKVSFAAVPADRLVLVVDDRKVLRAYREREAP